MNQKASLLQWLDQVQIHEKARNHEYGQGDSQYDFSAPYGK